MLGNQTFVLLFPEAAEKNDKDFAAPTGSVHPLEKVWGSVEDDPLARQLYGMASEYMRLHNELVDATPTRVVREAMSGNPESDEAKAFLATLQKYRAKCDVLMELFWQRVKDALGLWTPDANRAAIDVRGAGWQIVDVPVKHPMGRRPSRGASGPEDFFNSFFDGSREVDGLEDILDIFFGGGREADLLGNLFEVVSIGGRGDQSAKMRNDEDALAELLRAHLMLESDEELARVARRDCGNPRCKRHRIAAEVLAERQQAAARKTADEIDAATAAAIKPEAVDGALEPAEETPADDEQQRPEEAQAEPDPEIVAGPGSDSKIEELGDELNGATTGEGNEPVAVGETADGSGTPAEQA